MGVRSRHGVRMQAAALLVAASAGLMTSCTGATVTPTASIGQVRTATPSPSASERPSETAGAMPARFPVMPGMVADEPTPSEPGLIARWTTDANGAEVYRFFERAIPEAGYRIDLAAPGDTAAVIRFTPPSGQQLQIDLGQEGSGTFIELRLPRD